MLWQIDGPQLKDSKILDFLFRILYHLVGILIVKVLEDALHLKRHLFELLTKELRCKSVFEISEKPVLLLRSELVCFIDDTLQNLPEFLVKGK